MICVGYSKRASCDPNLSFLSLKEQNDQIREFVSVKGWKLACFYEDKSDSPDADNGFQKLREAGLRKEFDVVVFVSVYRFGANVSFARELLLNAFYKAGIHFVILEDNIDSMKMSYEELRDYFLSVRQRLNSVIGKYYEMKKTIETGQISEFNIKYGYKLSEDKTEFIVDDAAAMVIRKIFDMYDNDHSTGEICKFLNESAFDIPSYHIYKIFPEKGFTGENNWSASVINRIKKNHLYIGCEAEILNRKVYYPAILSEEQFVRVNEKVKGKSRGKKIKPRIENPFGAIYYIDENSVLKYKNSSPSKSYPYFHVTNSKKMIISYEELENAVRVRLEEEKKKCASVIGHIEAGHTQELLDSSNDEYAELIRDFARASEQYAQEKIDLFTEYESGNIDQEIYERKNDEIVSAVKELSEELQKKADEIETRKKMLSIDNPWIKRYMSYDYDIVYTRKIAKNLIRRIIVNDDGKVTVSLFCEEAKVFPVEWRCI